jgi:hypothetical protein
MKEIRNQTVVWILVMLAIIGSSIIIFSAVAPLFGCGFASTKQVQDLRDETDMRQKKIDESVHELKSDLEISKKDVSSFKEITAEQFSVVKTDIVQNRTDIKTTNIEVENKIVENKKESHQTQTNSTGLILGLAIIFFGFVFLVVVLIIYRSLKKGSLSVFG